MNRYFYLLILGLSFYACKPGIPEDIIQPGQMQDVLIDIHIADGYIATLPGSDTAKKVGASYYKGIFKKFEIDSALYNRSLDYYYKHPDLMKVMYDSITVRLMALKEKNPMVLTDELDKYIFKGIFDERAKDTTIYESGLNRKYNNRLLKTNVFTNITNPQALAPLNQVPVVQPVAVPAAQSQQSAAPPLPVAVP